MTEPKITFKCTACGKKFVLAEEGRRDIAEIGVVFSPCCKMIAVVQAVEVNARPYRG